MSETAFLQQLEAQPSDDTTRLVYADWLDEHDDPRGEFLRSVVFQQSLTVREGATLRHRILELRSKIPAAWLVRVLPGYAADDVREAVFRHSRGRGFSGRSFLSVEGGDPSWYLLDRLSSDYPDLWPMSKGRDGGHDCPGPRTSLYGLKWSSEVRCEVEIGIGLMPLAGNGARYGIELQGEQWVITDSQQTWIS